MPNLGSWTKAFAGVARLEVAPTCIFGARNEVGVVVRTDPMAKDPLNNARWNDEPRDGLCRRIPSRIDMFCSQFSSHNGAVAAHGKYIRDS